jgi:ureidoacrylate peracid hydrolase
MVKKYRYSAFMPGTSELPDRLRSRGFDTVLITGTVTNVCCEMIVAGLRRPRSARAA